MALGLNLFRHRMRDIIRTVPNAQPGTGATYQNLGRQHGQGFEAEGSWSPAPSWRWTANHAWQRSIDPATGRDVGNAPRRQSHLRTDWRFAPGWQASGTLNRIAGTQRVAGDARPPVPDYTTLDLALRTDGRNDRWDVALLLRNAGNADVREPSPAPGLIRDDLPMPRRTVSLQVGRLF